MATQVPRGHPELPLDIPHEVVDCDAHIMESMDDLLPYMEDDEAARYVESTSPIPRDGWDRSAGGRIGRAENATPEDEARKMADLSVDVSILSPTMNLYHGLIGSRRVANAVAQAYNDYLLDVWLDPTDVFKGGILVPADDPAYAAEEIDRLGDEEGFVNVMLNPVGPEKALGDERYDPIYAAAEANDLPIYLHGGATTAPAYPNQTNYFHEFLEVHSVGHTYQQTTQVTSLLCRGVPERFPDLTFVCVEAGLSWIPYLYRLDTEYISRRNEAPLLEQLPSEYFRERFYVSMQPIEEFPTAGAVETMVELAGGWGRILFATDWPHWDFDSPVVVQETVPEAHHAAVYHGNARAAFDL